MPKEEFVQQAGEKLGEASRTNRKETLPSIMDLKTVFLHMLLCLSK